VTVTAAAAMLNTGTSTIGQVVSNQYVNELPLNGRSFVSLIAVNAGVNQATGSVAGNSGLNVIGLNAGIAGTFQTSSVNGLREDSVSYLIDGITNTGLRWSEPVAIPPVDAIQEFKLQNGQYSTEYGVGSAQVNVAIKSGTNKLHGSGYDFIQNDFFQPDNKLNMAENQLKGTHLPLGTPLKQNQFGGSVGGPILLPKIYNGRDRSFFFFAYEGGRRHGASTASFTQAPTAAEMQGNFSDWPFPIYDPSTTGSVPATTNNPTGRTVFGATTANPAGTNVIPTSEFNPISKNLMSYFLTPNISCTLPCQNYVGTVPTPITTDNWIARIDQTVTTRDRLSLTLYKARDDEPYNSIVPSGSTIGFSHSKLGGLGWTHTFGGNAVNSLSLGGVYQFFHEGSVEANGPNLAAIAGFKNTSTIPAFYSIPQVILGDSYMGAGTYNNGYTMPNSTIEVIDNYKWIHGKHELTMGFDIRRRRYKNVYGVYSNGQLTFDGVYTSSNPTDAKTKPPGPTTGNYFADFLLGDPEALNAPSPFGSSDYNLRSTYYNGFFQDNYRITPSLTLNLGMRYEFPGEWHSIDGSGFVFNPNYPGGQITWASQAFVDSAVPNPIYFGCCTRPELVPAETKDFSPRIGWAWRPFGNSKAVVRGGYGLFFDSEMEYYEVYAWNDDWYATLSTPVYPAVIGNESVSPIALNTLYLPVNHIQPGSTLAPNYLYSAGNMWPPDHRPFVQQWALDVQYNLTPNTLLDVGYVGTHAEHQIILDFQNQATPPTVAGDSCNFLLAASQATGANAYCLSDPNFQPIETRAPYQNFAPTSLTRPHLGYSNYNGLQIRVEHRLSHGMALMGNFTWSKTLDIGNGMQEYNGNNGYGSDVPQQSHNLRTAYGISDFDIAGRAVLSYIYQVPVGRGRHWSFGKANYILGGWNSSGTIIVASGLPQGIYTAGRSGTDQMGNTRTENSRVNVSASPLKGFTKTIYEWFNTSVESAPPAGRWGALGKNTIRSTGQHVGNIALTKDVPFKDTRFNVQYRLEIFNVFSSSKATQQFANNALSSSPVGCTSGPSGTCAFGSLVPLNGLGYLNLWNPYTMQMALKLTW
jgi:hypothetical protein